MSWKRYNKPRSEAKEERKGTVNAMAHDQV
jgi:hypothetical protein